MHIRLLTHNDYPALHDLAKRQPIVNVYASSKLDEILDSPQSTFRLNVLGAFTGDTLESAVYIGANLVPINITYDVAAEFARHIRQYLRGAIPFTGQADQVLMLWEALRGYWPTPREIRQSQPLLALQERPLVAMDREVRYSRFTDLDALFPACVEMFTEEVGISPIAHGVAPYRTRVQDLVAQRHSFIRMHGNEVMFKTEVGAISAGVAQIQGVWMNPKFRGQGLAAPALAAVVNRVMDDIAPSVSLYVNDYNERALKTYRAIGFEQVDTFASILF